MRNSLSPQEADCLLSEVKEIVVLYNKQFSLVRLHIMFIPKFYKYSVVDDDDLCFKLAIVNIYVFGSY